MKRASISSGPTPSAPSNGLLSSGRLSSMAPPLSRLPNGRFSSTSSGGNRPTGMHSAPSSASSANVKFVNSTPDTLESQIKREEMGPKKKRMRTTPEQLRILNKEFALNPMPNSSARLLLAKRLGMTARAVQVWFQNRRAKAKLDARRSHGDSPPPSAHVSDHLLHHPHHHAHNASSFFAPQEDTTASTFDPRQLFPSQYQYSAPQQMHSYMGQPQHRRAFSHAGILYHPYGSTSTPMDGEEEEEEGGEEGDYYDAEDDGVLDDDIASPSVVAESAAASWVAPMLMYGNGTGKDADDWFFVQQSSAAAASATQARSQSSSPLALSLAKLPPTTSNHVPSATLEDAYYGPTTDMTLAAANGGPLDFFVDTPPPMPLSPLPSSGFSSMNAANFAKRSFSLPCIRMDPPTAFADYATTHPLLAEQDGLGWSDDRPPHPTSNGSTAITHYAADADVDFYGRP